MKTLTEFSGTMIRMAARAEAEARKALPAEVTRVAPGPVPSEGVTAKPNENASAGSTPEGADSVGDAADQAMAEQAGGSGSDVAGAPADREARAGEAGTTEDEMQPGAAEVEAREEAAASQDLSGQASDLQKSTPGGAKPSEVNADEAGNRSEVPAETSAVKEALDKAVSDATGTTGDRLDRLREALKAVGRQAERVRLVRVFPGDVEVAQAKRVGEHQYVVDLMPSSMKQVFERDDKDKRRGPKRPSGGGKQKGPEGSLEGGFTMESVAQDRRNERGPGRGRGGPGGGRPGGGRGRGGPGGRPPGGPGGGRPAGGRPGGGRPGGGRGAGAKPAGEPK